jgi:hypothetical protein
VSFRSSASAAFWKCYDDLPENIRQLADQKYALFESDPFHPSLGLQQKGAVWTVDVGRSYRAMARRSGNEFYWFWIGSHEEYNMRLRRQK